MSKIRTAIYVTEEERDIILALSEREGQSKTSIIRAGIHAVNSDRELLRESLVDVLVKR